MGFAVGLVLGRLENLEGLRESDLVNNGRDEFAGGRRGDGEGETAIAEEGDEFEDAGEGGAAFADELDDAGVDAGFDLLVGWTLPGIAGEPVLDELVGAETHGGEGEFLGEGDADGIEDLDFGQPPERFRVDEESVHVEDDGVNHGGDCSSGRRAGRNDCSYPATS
jgi:hypothetical protein